MTLDQLVAEIYKGYPEGVMSAASNSIQQHLDKLCLEDRITHSDSGFYVFRSKI
jgi:hypothetical protein